MYKRPTVMDNRVGTDLSGRGEQWRKNWDNCNWTTILKKSRQISDQGNVIQSCWWTRRWLEWPPGDLASPGFWVFSLGLIFSAGVGIGGNEESLFNQENHIQEEKRGVLFLSFNLNCLRLTTEIYKKKAWLFLFSVSTLSVEKIMKLRQLLVVH